jgi:type II secretory pathway pseudopilin PulG
MGCGAADHWQDGMTRARRERQLPGRTRRRASGRDDGFSVVEVVVTIVIMATVMVPILTAVISTIRASSNTRALAQLETVIQNASDRVNRAPTGCGYRLYAEAAARTQGWDASTVVVVEQHYVPGATPSAGGTWVANACDGPSVTALLVQLVSITITSPDSGAKKTIEVVKSEV